MMNGKRSRRFAAALSRHITVAAVQCSSRAASLRENVELVGPLVEAAAKSADLILLPEAFPQGYSYEPALVWPYVDCIDGDSLPSPTRAPASAALSALAKKHGVWIGSTVLERGSGTTATDVFNTFVLLQPDGHLHPARHTKRTPAAFENLVFSSPDDTRAHLPRVLDTPLGRLGISICFETYLAPTWAELAAQAPDVVLMPHCGGVGKASPYLPAAVVAAARRSMLSAPSEFARVLGVPTVFTNQVGRISSTLPGIFRPASFLTADIPFEGDARIHAGGGAELAAVGQNSAPGLTIATLDLTKKKHVLRPTAAEASQSLSHLALPPLLTRAFAVDMWLAGLWYHRQAEERARVFRSIGSHL